MMMILGGHGMGTVRFQSVFQAVLALVFLMLSAGCDVTRDYSSSGSSESLSLSDSDNGSSVQVGVGEVFDITLKESSMNGYLWEVDGPCSSILYNLNEQFNCDPFCNGTGCGGTTTLRFVATSPGEVSLRLVHRQAQDMGSRILDSSMSTFEVEVTVVDN